MSARGPSGPPSRSLLGRAAAEAASVSAGPLSKLFRLAAWVLLRVLPARRHAVVHGWPDSEGNAVEVVRGLLRRYPGRVVWLLEDAAAGTRRSLVPDHPRLLRTGKTSARALWWSLTAEATFFTHGLNTAVRPPADRLVVNLWHGDGPKATRRADRVKSTVAVSGAALWASYKADLFGLPSQRVLITGNPRIDQFDRAPSAHAWNRLGLSSSRPAVLWLPTYRQARGPLTQSWEDADRLTSSGEVSDVAAALAAEARSLDLDLLIKPHPLDGDDYAALGCRVVTNQALEAADVTLYQLLGRCQALISDVSSAWVDYLVLDRPVAFYLPDLADLQRRRGMNVPDVLAVMPGPQITDAEDARRWLRRLVESPDVLRPSRFAACPRVGAVTGTGATDRLLDALDDYQRSRGRPPLFGTAVTCVDSDAGTT